MMLDDLMMNFVIDDVSKFCLLIIFNTIFIFTEVIPGQIYQP
jgi:hypothetical protein